MSDQPILHILYRLPANGQSIHQHALSKLLQELKLDISDEQIVRGLEQLCALGLAVCPAPGEFARADRGQSGAAVGDFGFAELMAQIAATLIHNDRREIGRRITEALRRITEYTGADRGYVFDYDFERKLTSYKYEWCAPGISAQIDLCPSIPLAELNEAEWIEPHRRGEPVVIDDVASLKNEGLRKWLAAQDIKSVVTVPIMADDQCLGFIGFDAVRQHRRYGTTEVRLLETLARMLANLYWQEADRRALDQAHDDLDVIVEGAEVGTWIWWLRDGRLEINENWASMLGYTRKELEPISIEIWERLSHPEDLALAKEQIAQNLDGTLKYYDAKLRMRHKAGHWVIVQTRGRIMSRDPEGIVAVGIHQDVTEREQVNQDRQLLSNIINRSPVVAFRWCNEPGWPVEFVSENVEIFGYSVSDFTGGRVRFMDLVHPDDKDRIERDVTEYLANGPDAYRQNYRFLHGQGHWVWVDDFTWLTRDHNGKVTEINGVLLDITDRKQLERAIRLHATLINNSVDVVVLRDSELRYRTVNQGFLSLSHQSLESVIGRTDVEVFGHDVPQHYIDVYQNNTRRALALKRGESFVVEDRFPGPDGLDRLFRTRHFAVFDEETDELLGAATISIEITDLKRTQDALVSSEHRFRALFEKSPVAILMHDPVTGAVLEANEQALAFYQVESVAQVNDRRMWNQSTPYSVDDALALIHKSVQEGRQSFEWRSFSPAGAVIWESVTLEPVRLDGSLRVLSISIDITERILAQQALAQSEERFRGLLEHLPNVAVQGIDADKRVIFWNLGSEVLYGYTAAEAIGRSLFELIIPEEMQARILTDLDRWIAGGPALAAAEMELRDKNGARKYVYSSHVLRQSPSGDPEIYSIDVDLTDQKSAQKRLELLARVFSHSYDGVVITSKDARIVEVNDRYCAMTGYERHEIIGQNPSMLHSGRQDKAFYQAMWAHLSEQGYWLGEIWNRKKTGEVFAIETRITSIKDSRGEVVNYIANVTEITERLNYEEKLKHVAFFDELTGLPNRTSVSEMLRQAVARYHLHDMPLAVVFIDLDEFKTINDTHDHETGDRYLQEIATRLQSIIREGDVAARFGGDEFVLVIQNLEQARPDHPVFARLLAALRDPVLLDGKVLRLTASFGVTFYPQHVAVDADQLLRQADQAMYSAKQNGKNKIVFFDTEFERAIIDRNARTEALRRAIGNGELVLHYQPQVDMAAGSVLGVEALVRWNHPTEGLLYPGSFLDLIQDNESLGVALSRWVLAQALDDLGRLQGLGYTLGMSVNIIIPAIDSMRADFLDYLQEMLCRHSGMNPAQLTLEIVENVLIDDFSKATSAINQMQKLGLKISLDDFGTGFSSLSYLKHLSFNELKIDQGFVRDMLHDREDMTIVQAVVTLSQSFGVPVIAEGVETARHAEMLLRLGCTRAQGYAISKPQPIDRLEAWLRDWQPDPEWKHIAPMSSHLYPLASMLSAHVGWVESLEKYLRNEVADSPVLDTASCGFGEMLSQHPSLIDGQDFGKKVTEYHEALHVAGAAAVAAHRSEDKVQEQVHFAQVVTLSRKIQTLIWERLK